jgi:hypothetical protein
MAGSSSEQLYSIFPHLQHGFTDMLYEIPPDQVIAIVQICAEGVGLDWRL